MYTTQMGLNYTSLPFPSVTMVHKIIATVFITAAWHQLFSFIFLTSLSADFLRQIT